MKAFQRREEGSIRKVEQLIVESPAWCHGLAEWCLTTDTTGIPNMLRRVYHIYVGKFRSRMRFPTYGVSVGSQVTRSADPIRYSTLALALTRLDRDCIQGAMAELGVYRGETSRLLHICAPERTLHLFDTFTGFPDGFTADKPDRFRATSVESVKQRIGDCSNVFLHVGIFPETALDVHAERFALVMLDADCYPSTRAGLEFFYPRTVPGGYIFLHDFNNPESDWGVTRAATEFMANKPERLIEIPDTWGTAFFRRIG
jgi:O-methyltransferase